MKALDESKNLVAVQDKKLYVTAASTGKGTVTKEGNENGIYTWEVQIPILVTYKSPTETISQNLVVKAEIVRVLSSQSSQGIAFQNITASLASAEPAKAATTPPPAQPVTK
jgi:intracellular multiplication protein IcmL